jgi:hypothetical protein
MAQYSEFTKENLRLWQDIVLEMRVSKIEEGKINPPERTEQYVQILGLLCDAPESEVCKAAVALRDAISKGTDTSTLEQALFTL